MSDVFEEIARAARGRSGAPVSQPDAQPADANALFLEIARQVVPPPAQAAPQQEAPGFGRQMLQAAGQFGAGFNERGAQIAGALPDLYNRGLRAVGLPALSDGAYTRGIQRGVNAVVGEPPAPQGGVQEFARGAGQGVADAASVMIPATGIAQAARAGTITGGAASTLAAQPATQAVAGAVGGGVAEVTDR